MSSVVPPLNVPQLNERLVHVAHELGIPVARARVMLCTLIVSQMLPDAVAIKGGMGIKLRMGERGTRATSDLDVSTRARGAEFERAFGTRLAEGWGAVPPSKGELRRSSAADDRVAFSATVRAGRIHVPGLAHPEHVMHPTECRSRSWGARGARWTLRSRIPKSTRKRTREWRSTVTSCSSVRTSVSENCSPFIWSIWNSR